ncbi:MAG: hypothetical protein DCC55_07350 [Chloroflexi bacterium]|nr:MAG: hypothetical protein DCC55_07350 [Chloroflexota bacterium]
MHVISKKTLQAFWRRHRVDEKPLRGWFVRVKQSTWNNFAELRQDFPSADQVYIHASPPLCIPTTLPNTPS